MIPLGNSVDFSRGMRILCKCAKISNDSYKYQALDRLRQLHKLNSVLPVLCLIMLIRAIRTFSKLSRIPFRPCYLDISNIHRLYIRGIASYRVNVIFTSGQTLNPEVEEIQVTSKRPYSCGDNFLTLIRCCHYASVVKRALHVGTQRIPSDCSVQNQLK